VGGAINSLVFIILRLARNGCSKSDAVTRRFGGYGKNLPVVFDLSIVPVSRVLEVDYNLSYPVVFQFFHL